VGDGVFDKWAMAYLARGMMADLKHVTMAVVFHTPVLALGGAGGWKTPVFGACKGTAFEQE
jgi:hypothetical protein